VAGDAVEFAEARRCGRGEDVVSTQVRALLLTLLAASFSQVAFDALADGEAPTTTPIQESHFAVALPGTWAPIKGVDAALFAYQSSDRNEQFTATIYLASPPAPGEELESIYAKYRRDRLQAEVHLSGAEINVKDGPLQRAGGSVMGSYLGHHVGTKRRFASFTIVRPDLVASFILSSVDPSEPDFEARFLAIAGSIRLPPPGAAATQPAS
jgi:hypothetical protein